MARKPKRVTTEQMAELVIEALGRMTAEEKAETRDHLYFAFFAVPLPKGFWMRKANEMGKKRGAN